MSPAPKNNLPSLLDPNQCLADAHCTYTLGPAFTFPETFTVVKLGASIISLFHTLFIPRSAAVRELSWISELSIVPSVILSPFIDVISEPFQIKLDAVRELGKLAVPFVLKLNLFAQAYHDCFQVIILTLPSAERNKFSDVVVDTTPISAAREAHPSPA